MAQIPSSLNRKVLQHLRTQLTAEQIGPHGLSTGRLKDVACSGELVVQLGDSGNTVSGTSLWTLAADGVTAIRFVNQAYVDSVVGGTSDYLIAEIDRIETALGLTNDSQGVPDSNNDDGNLPADWNDSTEYRYITSATTAVQALQILDKALQRVDDAILDSLNVNSVNSDTDKVLVDLAQHDGLIGSAVTKNIGQFTITGYTVGGDDSGKLAETDTLNAALGKLQGQINGMDKAADAQTGHIVTTVSEEDGKVSETKALLVDVQLSGLTGTTLVSSGDTLGEAIEKIENEIKANDISNADGSINVTTAATGTDINVNIKSGEHVLAKDANRAGLYTDIKLSGVTPSSVNVKEEYALVGTDGTQLGETIKVYKDSSLNSVTLSGDTEVGGQWMIFNYTLADGTTQDVAVDVSKFLAEAEFADGLIVGNDGVVKVNIDPTSEDYLTVSPDGLKLSGINEALSSVTTEINTTVAGDATKTHMGISATTAADGHTVYEFGLYDVASQSQLQALSGVVADLDATVSAETTHVGVEIVEQDGKLTAVTLTETDIASASALTAEIARAQSAETALDGVIGSTKDANTEARTYGHNDTNYLNANDTVKEDVETLDSLLGSHDDADNKYDVEFTSGDTVADKIADILKQIDANKEALKLTSTDGDYVTTTVTTAATGTNIDVQVTVQDIATSTGLTQGLADAYNVKQFAINNVYDVNNNGALTKIAVKTDETTGVRLLDVSNLCVDCGTF